MSRIEGALKALKGQGRKALIPYITAGDPHPDTTVELMHTLVEAGSDIIELGVPFSDPMADGPVIQRACERSLKHGTSLRQVLAMVKEFRTKDADTPVVLMGRIQLSGSGLVHEAPYRPGLEQALHAACQSSLFTPARRKSCVIATDVGFTGGSSSSSASRPAGPSRCC